MTLNNLAKRWNLFDLFVALLVILAGLAVYFTFIRPIQFSSLIQREGINRYAEVEIILPEDLAWLREAMLPGEESRNVYGQLDWKLIQFGEETIGGERLTKLTAKLLVVVYSSGIVRYGKYTLVKGSPIYLINDRYFLEGRVYNYRILDEQTLI